MLFNQIIIFIKRMCNKIIYVSMLLLLVILTIIFQLLPEKKQSTSINVPVYSEADSTYTDMLIEHLKQKNSIYSFYQADSKEILLDDVKTGRAECGFFIPEDFFTDYINGTVTDNKICCYSIPSSTMSSAITETFFNSVYRICAKDILLAAANLDEYYQELSDTYEKYLESDEIFQLSDIQNGQYVFQDMVYKVNIPVFEISLLLILFSGLLGLYLHMQDKERGIYAALSSTSLLQIESASILAAIIPVLIISLISSALTYGISMKLVYTIVFSLFTYPVCILLGIVTRKQRHLSKLLPLILLCAIILVFISTLIK